MGSPAPARFHCGRRHQTQVVYCVVMALLTVLLPLVGASCVILLLSLLLAKMSQQQRATHQVLARISNNLMETMKIDLVDRKISSTDISTLDLEEDVSSSSRVLSSVYVY